MGLFPSPARAPVRLTRRALCDWLSSMKLQPADAEEAALDRHIGYWQPYALSHDELDADEAVQQEVRNAAIERACAGSLTPIGAQLPVPREK